MSFFDSHPTTPERAREGREYASTLAVEPADRIAIDRTAFVHRLAGLVVGPSARGGVFLDHRFVHPELGFALTFPEGWKHENGPTAVVAYPENESAIMGLQVVAEGDDPATVADEIASQVELLDRSEVKRVNGLPVVTANTTITQDRQELSLALAWIAKDGLIYQVLGATTPPNWAEYRPIFEATAATFRRPSQGELGELREDRLRVVTAKQGETLSALAKRAQSRWSVERVAAANAMSAGAKLSGGEAVKISKREPYLASGQALPQ
jgi:predicted Zn-dependent protease